MMKTLTSKQSTYYVFDRQTDKQVRVRHVYHNSSSAEVTFKHWENQFRVAIPNKPASHEDNTNIYNTSNNPVYC